MIKHVGICWIVGTVLEIYLSQARNLDFALELTENFMFVSKNKYRYSRRHMLQTEASSVHQLQSSRSRVPVAEQFL